MLGNNSESSNSANSSEHMEIDEVLQNIVGFISSNKEDNYDAQNKDKARASFVWYIQNIYAGDELRDAMTQHGANFLLNVSLFFVYRILFVLNRDRGGHMDRSLIHTLTLLILNDCINGVFNTLFDMII